jgi:hypothetical protein
LRLFNVKKKATQPFNEGFLMRGRFVLSSLMRSATSRSSLRASAPPAKEVKAKAFENPLKVRFQRNIAKKDVTKKVTD